MPNDQTLTLHWLPSIRASCVYAAAAIADGETISDSRLICALAQPAASIRAVFQQLGVSQHIWQQLVPLAVTTKTWPEFVQVLLSRAHRQVAQTGGSVFELAERCAELEHAMAVVFPRLADDLDLRSRPLQEQWEARGPGLWLQLGQLLWPKTFTNAAAVALVHPVFGGGGISCGDHNTVVFEAVLANSIPELPEVVRLAWLLSQLPPSPPVNSKAADDTPDTIIIALGLLPVVLRAAEHVELARLDVATLALAVRSWLPRVPDPDRIAERLNAWWMGGNQYHTWNVRLSILSSDVGFILRYASPDRP